MRSASASSSSPAPGAESASGGGHDNIGRADLAFTVRIRDQHAVSVRYLWSRRDASNPFTGPSMQTRGTLGSFYVLLGRDRFGSD